MTLDQCMKQTGKESCSNKAGACNLNKTLNNNSRSGSKLSSQSKTQFTQRVKTHETSKTNSDIRCQAQVYEFQDVDQCYCFGY